MDELLNLNPYAGTDIYRMTPGLILLERLRCVCLVENVAWVLPPSELPGVGSAWAVPVVRAPVSGLYLAHRFDAAATCPAS
jgi:hypothetical protein